MWYFIKQFFNKFEQTRNNMFSLLQGSSYTSQSVRHTTFINKEIDALEARRSQLSKKIRQMQNSKNATASLRQQLQKQQQELQESSSVVKNAKIKLQKYKLKKIDLQNNRMAEIIVYQQLQLQLQSLKKELVEVFTPKSNQLQLLRLKLIQIESDQELIKFSKQFSLRKVVLLFLKNNKIEIQDVITVELQISKRNLVGQFQIFIQEYLNNKKLNEFRKLLKEPIQKYVQTLQQIRQTAIFQQLRENQNQEDQQIKRHSLITQWNTRKHDLLTKKNEIDTIDYKIQQNNKKIKRYEEEVKESIDKWKQFQNQIKYYSQIRETQKQEEKTLSKLRKQLGELNEAVNYLSNKRNQQNSNFLNSPKSMGLIDSLQHSKTSKSLALQNCEISNSNVLSRSTKYSDASLFKSPKSTIPKDRLSSKFKKPTSPFFR